MRGRGKRAAGHRGRQPAMRTSWVAGSVTLLLTLVAVMWPMTAAPVASTSALLAAIPSAQAPAVGALFATGAGRLGQHFCTASVVDSPAGDLVMTAAHCVVGYSDTRPADMAFVPAYDNGATPYGVWKVTRIYVDAAWAGQSNPDDDVAFLAVARPGGQPVESVTGSERLGIDEPASRIVRVTGYPDTVDRPISCQNRTIVLSATQLEFDCDNFTNGTSGSPFLLDEGTATGSPTVIGVIGGYEQGGSSADVSYSAVLGDNIKALYDRATRSNLPG